MYQNRVTEHLVGKNQKEKKKQLRVTGSRDWADHLFWSILDDSEGSVQPKKMTKLQFLNVFLTERLMLAAQEIYKSVEDTILEYQEEIAIRERENDHLRRRLRDAGIEIWPG